MGPGLKDRRAGMDEPYGMPLKRSRQARQSRFARYPDEDEIRGGEGTRVDFNKLKVVSLRKYAKLYDLDVSPQAPKEDLIYAITKHWTQQPPLSEYEVLVRFTTAARRQNPNGNPMR